jgi:hypothetical protein
VQEEEKDENVEEEKTSVYKMKRSSSILHPVGPVTVGVLTLQEFVHINLLSNVELEYIPLYKCLPFC